MPFRTGLRSGLLPTLRPVALALLTVFFFGMPVHATQYSWPALHDVIDVAENDVLHIRAAPDPKAEIIGTLAYDAKSVEVIAPNEDETWGLVNIREHSGWVSLRFLARHSGQLEGQFPAFTSCYGTEPFWSLEREDGTLTFDVAFDDRPATAELIEWEAGTINHWHRFSFGSSNMVGVIARQSCNDGMSDQEFGLELNLVLPKEQSHLQGCCSIAPRAR